MALQEYRRKRDFKVTSVKVGLGKPTSKLDGQLRVPFVASGSVQSLPTF